MDVTLKTVAVYQALGNQTSYNFGFDYLSPEFIKVYVNGLTVYDYTLNGRQILFNEAPQGILRVQRSTPTDQIVSWSAGSVLRSKDMTISQVQQLHILEETSDALIENSIVTTNGNWWGQSKRLTEVADPIDAQDVVTKHYMESVQGGFIATNTQLKNEVTEKANIVHSEYLETLDNAAKVEDIATNMESGIYTVFFSANDWVLVGSQYEIRISHNDKRCIAVNRTINVADKVSQRVFAGISETPTHIVVESLDAFNGSVDFALLTKKDADLVYTKDFLTTDFTSSTSFFILTIPSTEHNCGLNVFCECVLRQVGSTLIEVRPHIERMPNGDILITTDELFDGKIILNGGIF